MSTPLAAAPLDSGTAGFTRGSSGYRRATAALCAAGMATFTLLYVAQALLPQLADGFHLAPAQASLALSATTAALAISLLPAGVAAARWGAAPVMRWSLVAAAAIGLLVPLAPTFEVLVGLRALQGVAMAGVPALCMAYLGRAVHPAALGGAVGILVAGNTMGGLAGRLVGGAVTDLGGWRAGFLAVGILSAACLAVFWRLLPPVPERRGEQVALPVRALLGEPDLRRLFGLGFLLTAAFVTVYNYLGFRLLEPPFDLSATAVGLIFLCYVAGTFAATLAGRAGDAAGRRPVLLGSLVLAAAGLAGTLATGLFGVIAGLAVFTVGFFGAHSVVSAWVAARGSAQASSLYLVAYYAGSGIGGSATGLVFAGWGWPGVVAVVGALLAAALATAVRLPRSA